MKTSAAPTRLVQEMIRLVMATALAQHGGALRSRSVLRRVGSSFISRTWRRGCGRIVRSGARFAVNLSDRERWSPEPSGGWQFG